MVQYLYQKRYTVNIDDYPDVEDDGEDGNSEDSQAKANRTLDTVLQEAGRDDGNGDAKPAQDEFIPLEQNLALVLLHVHVNGIADYYDIPGLKDMANRNIKRILNKIEALDGFTDIIEETLNYTNDPDLHQIIAECAAMHITDLVETKDFFEKGAITQFPAAIINVMAQTYPKAIVKLEKSLADAQSEAEQMRTELRDLNQRINNLMHHTQRIRRCRNRDCRQELSGYLDVYNGEYTYRCSQCRCKHPRRNRQPPNDDNSNY